VRLVLNASAAIEVVLARTKAREYERILEEAAEVLASDLIIPRAYDMFYLSLARREDAGFLTSDGSLRREAERQGIRLL
jgi:predicted nucleic acid-binding protein